MNRDDEIRDKGRKTLKSLASFLFPPIDALWGICKGIPAFFKNPREYISGLSAGYSKDKLGASLPYTFSLSRISTLIFTGIVIAGFLGALALPLPGTAPLFALTAGAIAKAAGISFCWMTFGRVGGAFVGGLLDYRRIKKVEQNADKYGAQSQNYRYKMKWYFPLATATKVGLFGEALIEATQVLKAAWRFLADRCCGSTRKSSGTQSNPGSRAEHSVAESRTSLRSVSSFSGTRTSRIMTAVDARTKPMSIQHTDSFGYRSERIDQDPRANSVTASPALTIAPPPSEETGSYVPPSVKNVLFSPPTPVTDGEEFERQSTLQFGKTNGNP